MNTAPDATAAAAAVDSVRRRPLCRRVSDFLTRWMAASGRVSARVVVACSGGPDSTALMLLLWALRTELALEVHVVCVDHQLRPAARDEAELVVSVAGQLGLTAERVAVSCPAGPSKMATARLARYDALAQAAQRLGAAAVLVAHTQQDQTETMLMRWLGGAGLLGLCGIEDQRELAVPGQTNTVTILRPLLTTSRDDIESFLRAEAPRVAPLPLHDPSNHDRHYQRARLRHDLLPPLRQEQPQLDGRLTQLSAQLRDDSDYLEQQADAAYAALRGRQAVDGIPCITLPLAATAALPPALFARVIMRASGGGLGQPHIAAVRGLCAHTQGTQALDLPGGRRVERRYTALCFLTPTVPRYSATNPPPEQMLPTCGHYVFWQGTLDLQWVSPSEDTAAASSLTSLRPATADLLTAGLHEARLVLTPPAFPLTLRAPRPGDRIRIYGSGGTRKVSDLLIDLKVPRFARAGVALLCAGDEILWVVGHRLATPPAGPPAAATRVLNVRFVPAPVAAI